MRQLGAKVHTSHSTTDARDYWRAASVSIRKIPQKSDARASGGEVHQHVRDATGMLPLANYISV